jgi:hypothetical protein
VLRLKVDVNNASWVIAEKENLIAALKLEVEIVHLIEKLEIGLRVAGNFED